MRRNNAKVRFYQQAVSLLIMLHFWGFLAHSPRLCSADDTSIQPGDIMQVASGEARLRLAQDVVASLRKGLRLKVQRVQPPWLRVEATIDGRTKQGWMHSRYVNALGSSGRATKTLIANATGRSVVYRARQAGDLVWSEYHTLEDGNTHTYPTNSVLLSRIKVDDEDQTHVLMPGTHYELKGPPDRGLFGLLSKGPTPVELGGSKPSSRPKLTIELHKRAESTVHDQDDSSVALATPQLTALMKDLDPAVRAAAAHAAKELGPRADRIVPALIRAFDDAYPLVRIESIHSLRALGPSAKVAVPHLINQLETSNPVVRANVAIALLELDPSNRAPVRSIVEMLTDEDDTVRVFGAMAAEALAKSPSAGEAVQALAELLKKDGNPIAAMQAAYTLGLLGPKAESAVPSLIEALRNESIIQMGGGASGALAKIGEAAVPKLIHALKDHDKKVRAGAARALAGIGPPAKTAAPSLVAALKDSNEEVRLLAAKALGRIGSTAEPTVSALRAALNDPAAPVRAAAAVAMLNLGIKDQAAVSALERALKGEGNSFGAGAILEELGPAASAAVPFLCETVKAGDILIRDDAAAALGRIRVVEKEVILALSEALGGFFASEASAKALANLGSPGLPPLIGALREDGGSSRYAATALALMGKDAVPALVELVVNGNTSDRRKAVSVLGQIGPPASAAVPHLFELLDDVHEEVRSDAAEALDQITANPSDD